MTKTKFSKLLCGVVAALMAGTLVASAAEPVTVFDAAQIHAAQGTMSSDADGNVILKHNPNNKADHSIYGLEAKDDAGKHIKYDGKKSYTIVVEARVDSYEGDEQGMKATEKDARVFAIDPKIRVDGAREENVDDPVDGWFTVEEMTGNNALDEQGFGKYYVVLTPETSKYEAIEGINFEHRIRFMAASDNMFMNIAIKSISVYEGEVKIEGGVRSQDNQKKDDSEEDEAAKAGTSFYGKKGQKAKYKGSNKDLVNADFTLKGKGTNQIAPKTLASTEGEAVYKSAETSFNGESIPQAGSSGAGMIVLAMCAAAAIGGTALVLGKKKHHK